MEQVKQHSLKAWWLAARPKTLSAALIPVITASALAFSDGAFDWCKALLCVAFAACMQIAANMINDLYDYLRGTMARSDSVRAEPVPKDGFRPVQCAAE